MITQFSYDNPVDAVFLRILAWELYVAKRNPRVTDLCEDQVQLAREELGLNEFKKGGGARDFIQKLRPNFLSPNQTPPVPIEKGWKENWRLLYLPSHSTVRQASKGPVEESINETAAQKEFRITLRNPSLPTLRVFVGTGKPSFDEQTKSLRGLYFLREEDGLYIGKTDEFEVRHGGHLKEKRPIWWVLVSPEDADNFTLDTLGAAEGLLISFWNEVSVIKNNKRGCDRKPPFIYLQPAILMTEAASAVLLWLIREKKDLFPKGSSIPFKKPGIKGWPECYIG